MVLPLMNFCFAWITLFLCQPKKEEQKTKKIHLNAYHTPVAAAAAAAEKLVSMSYKSIKKLYGFAFFANAFKCIWHLFFTFWPFFGGQVSRALFCCTAQTEHLHHS